MERSVVRRVFFSFDYTGDIWRANVVRNSWIAQDRESVIFGDLSLWESTKTKGDAAIKALIEERLKKTSVTVVLIGSYTSKNGFVIYEIEKSYERGNGLLGVYIHKLKNQNGSTDIKGENPFDYVHIKRDDKQIPLSKIYPTYDWVDDNGYSNFSKWVEQAARQVGRGYDVSVSYNNLTHKVKKPVQVFLSYASEDLYMIRRIYQGLLNRGINVWFDKENLGPGKWKPQIEKAIPCSRYFLICVSENALRKIGDEPGYQDEELYIAFSIAQQQPETKFTIVPVRLEDCGLDDNRIRGYQFYDVFHDFERDLDKLANDLYRWC